MIVVVASQLDDEAAVLVRQWGSQVALLTPRDLSRPHWRYLSHDPADSVAVISGRAVRCSEIRGVLTLTPTIVDAELQHIAAEDRQYVAAEMHAFLYAWLSSLRCPVVNRPMQGALWGPQWCRERWMWLAHQAGMSVWPGGSTVDTLTTTCVVGKQLFGCDEPDLAEATCRLARSVGLVTLTAMVYEGAFVHASPRPALGVAGVAEALRSRLETGCS